ncbi:MAG: hypothetical protein ABWZ66_01330 [Pyrinomonadaceae bacterium]
MHVSFEGRRPENIEFVSHKLCVLYDPRDGRIVHFHQVITLPGGTEDSTAEIEETALETAREHHDISRLRVLHTTPEEFGYDAKKSYRVNPARMSMEEVPETRLRDLRPGTPVRQDSGKKILIGALAGSVLAYIFTRR